MSDTSSIPELVEQLATLLRAQNRSLSTIESCTGGLVGASLTEQPGISDVYIGGFVTYSNLAKQLTAGVNPHTLVQHGAVSAQVCIEMAKGGGAKLLSTNAIAITGIAGPNGGCKDKPVGTVWICVVTSIGSYDCRLFQFPKDDGRAEIRQCALRASLLMSIQQLNDEYQQLDHQRERLNA